jgi:predicted CoA-binding protein
MALDDFAFLLTDSATSIAVVGASDDPHKWGGRIYRSLKAKGFRVWAVNPHQEMVDGDRCFPSVAQLPAPPTIVDLVVPPAAALEVLRSCRDLGFTRVWLQPGVDSPEALAYLESGGFRYRVGHCIMQRTVTLPGAPGASGPSGSAA